MKKLFIILVIVVILIIVVILYSFMSLKTINLKQTSPFYELSIYKKGRLIINKESPFYTKINKWLSKNSDGWQRSMITYVPNKILYGEDFNINFLYQFAILNIENKEIWEQYTKELKNDNILKFPLLPEPVQEEIQKN